MRYSLLKLIQGYKIFAVIILNTLVVLFLLNFAAGRWQAKQISSEYKPVNYLDRREVYPGYSADDIALLMKESWYKPFQYEPWVGFRERPRRGKFVNISEQGFRYVSQKNASLNDPGIKIFVFGGSTTFGYGVEDARTIPAYLQQRVSTAYPGKIVQVFNFGRAYYYSAQEVILLLDLLRKGYSPEIAIFIDGWNESPTAPYYSDEMFFLFEGYNYSPTNVKKITFAQIPIVDFVRKKFGFGNQSKPDFRRTKWRTNPNEVRSEYLRNREIVNSLSREYKFKAYFFIHPVPGYRNSFSNHKFWKGRTAEDVRAANAKMHALDATVNSENAFSMTHVLEGYPDQPFVDAIHFTPEVCDLLATFVAEKIRTE